VPPGDVGDVLDESDPGTGRGQLRQTRIGPDHAPLHFLDEERAMVRRHESDQAICLRPRGIGSTHPMVLTFGSPFLLAARAATASSMSRAATAMPTPAKDRAVAASDPDPPP
jgi:hypothetical protein